MDFIKGKNPSGYYEVNNTDRYSTQLSFEHHFGKCSHFTFKNSFNHFQRGISSPSYAFTGTQNGTFSEVTYANHGARSEEIKQLGVSFFEQISFLMSQGRVQDR